MYKLVSLCLFGFIALNKAASRDELRDALNNVITDEDDRARLEDYLDFLETFGKLPDMNKDEVEELMNRFLNWKATDDKIKLKDGNNWDFGHTRFSDWSDDEKKQILLDESFINSDKRSGIEATNCQKVSLIDSSVSNDKEKIVSKTTTSYNVDHRTSDIAGIQDQGSCGSCWDFSDVATLELNRNLDLGLTTDNSDSETSFVKFSEQMVLDCVDDDIGTCDGGYPILTLMWIKENSGIAQTSDYSDYVAEEETCDSSVDLSDAAVFDELFCLNDETAEQVTIAASTFSVEMAFKVYSDFFNYAGGVYSCDTSDTFEGWHAVSIVGVTSEYFIIKNSWSTSWGDNGYFYMSQDSFDDCGMSQFAFVSFNNLDAALSDENENVKTMDVATVATIRSNNLESKLINNIEKEENIPGLDKIKVGGSTNHTILIVLGAVVALSLILCFSGMMYKAFKNCKTQRMLKAVAKAQGTNEESALLDGYVAL